MNLEGSRESLTLTPQKIEWGRSSVEFLPQRGGIITDVELAKKRILYMQPSTLIDPTKNVRGGIPILFPNSGPAHDPQFPNLKQHGFARDSARWTYIKSPDGRSFTESLTSNEATEKIFPYRFLLELDCKLDEDKVTFIQRVQNQGSTDMPLSMGLHPYFPVAPAEKGNIKFNFAGGEEIEKRKEEWMNDKMIAIDNPKEFAPNADMPVKIPGLGTLVLEASEEYEKIGVWSKPDEPYVCVEPMLRAHGGISEDPQIVAPNQIYEAEFSIKLER